MDLIVKNLKNIRVPQTCDRIYKEECMFSFDTPESETGLYVCLNAFYGWGKEHVVKYSDYTNNHVFLHIVRERKEIVLAKELEPEKKIARLAIGVEGGFDPDVGKKKYEFEEHYSVVVLPGFEAVEFPNENLPLLVTQCVNGILKADPVLHRLNVEGTSCSWDGEALAVSKYADTLVQLDNEVKIPSSGWVCQKCDKEENLWLNLSDGAILCGRRQLDGSGGNNHAIDHYKITGYPLAVKLGTITPDGKADVFSYAEDDMVLDPKLKQHLHHFGINMFDMQKTEKTMAELEIDINQKAWEWSRITESGEKLLPKFGPGFTGLRNLGNSCYINSVMQVLFTVSDFVKKFYQGRKEILTYFYGSDSTSDFCVQMSKLAYGLLSGRYSPVPAEQDLENKDIDDLQPGIAPVVFRNLVGQGHVEFSTKRQQDAMEFLHHILKLTTRNSRHKEDPGQCFKMEVEDKVVCSVSSKVRYVTRSELYLPLPVPCEAATNIEEVMAYKERKAEARKSNEVVQPEEQVRYRIPFEACYSKLVAPEEVMLNSSAAGDKIVPMQKASRLRTFPDYLFVQLIKFDVSDSRQPMKLDVSVPMPELLDLSAMKAYGLQEGEEELPNRTSVKQSQPCIDENVVSQLAEMGFPAEACRKAIHLTGNCGSEAALNWIMEHMNDPDFSSPLPALARVSDASSFIPSEEGLSMLMAVGFTKDQAALALRETGNNIERAADWIFSHQHELESLLAPSGTASAPVKEQFTDGEPQYELVAFISHMGESVHVGHYVCHIKKEDEWTIFNDNKVSQSVNPPLDLGYIYLYKRLS